MSRPEAGRAASFPLSQAIALGALQGPAELLPVSSSAHLGVLPWLLGWSYSELDEPVRKSFEVALHAGTAAALALVLRRGSTPRVEPVTVALLAGACGPPALAGYSLEGAIERRLSRPGTVAAALVAGSLVMALADRAPEKRAARDADAVDGLWLGVAQATALVPGVSRSAATQSAARLRGFSRADAARLSELVGLPVIAGAAALRATRSLQRGLEPSLRAAFALGAVAAFVSTLATGRHLHRLSRGRALTPWAAYRLVVAAAILGRIRRDSTARRPPAARP